MADFTTLMNRGHRRYIDKNLKKRFFGKCEGCERRALLVIGTQTVEGDSLEWNLCSKCYDKFVVDDAD